MSRHLSDGELRAALDSELDRPAMQHLESCHLCQLRMRPIQEQAKEVGRDLAFLGPQDSTQVPATASSLVNFYEIKLKQKEMSTMKRLVGSRTVQAFALTILALAVIVTVPATRAVADHLLNLFRIQQVTVLPVDFTGLETLNGNSALGKQISQLVSDSVTVSQSPGAPVAAASAADASQKTGFTVRLPSTESYSRLTVRSAAAFNFTIDRAKAQALLDEAGRSDLVLPNDIDGQVVSVTIPASARADYGTCPDPSTADGTQAGSPGRNYPDCVILFEIPSPTVDAPASVDVAQLAQIGLEFTGMTADQAAAFTSSVDWTSTLVVPVPKNAATYQQLTVDGVTGTLIQRPADDAPQYVLLWVKNGIVYAIGGLGADSQRAIDMANSLP